MPARLPSRFQLGGVAYALAGSVPPGDVGELAPFGCIGAFEVATAEGEDRAQVLYLRTATTAADAVYRFEAAVTYNVTFEISGRPQVIAAADEQFRLNQAWQSSIYSSTTVLLFASDPENAAPDLFYGVDISGSARGDAVGEYRLSNETDQPSDELAAAATEAGLNPDLIVAGQRYLLTGIYLPAGTTTNGFVTLFSPATEGVENRVLGRDLRRLELFIYEPIAAPETGG